MNQLRIVLSISLGFFSAACQKNKSSSSSPFPTVCAGYPFVDDGSVSCGTSLGGSMSDSDVKAAVSEKSLVLLNDGFVEDSEIAASYLRLSDDGKYQLLSLSRTDLEFTDDKGLKMAIVLGEINKGNYSIKGGVLRMDRPLFSSCELRNEAVTRGELFISTKGKEKALVMKNSGLMKSFLNSSTLVDLNYVETVNYDIKKSGIQKLFNDGTNRFLILGCFDSANIGFEENIKLK